MSTTMTSRNWALVGTVAITGSLGLLVGMVVRAFTGVEIELAAIAGVAVAVIITPVTWSFCLREAKQMEVRRAYRKD